MKWNLEIEYIESQAKSTFTVDGKLIASLRWVQGMYFDENNRLATPEKTEMLLGILRLLHDNKNKQHENAQS